jgi:septal ring factor EnvC (AmiA/AmiB activator)
MEYVVLLVLGLLAAVFGYKRKADKAEANSKIAETKGRDKELELTQKEIENYINEIDSNISKMKAKQEAEARKRSEDNMSLKERADRIKKGLQ